MDKDVQYLLTILEKCKDQFKTNNNFLMDQRLDNSRILHIMADNQENVEEIDAALNKFAFYSYENRRG